MLFRSLAAAQVLVGEGLPVVIHAITDGRDVAPTSAAAFLPVLEGALPEGAKICTVIGRYWALDRDNRWERVSQAYDAMVRGVGREAADEAATAISSAYARGETDEFIQATVIGGYDGAKDGDGFFCLNFRSDRAREILRAIGEHGFAEFDTAPRPVWSALLGMVEYSIGHNAYMSAVYPRRDLKNTLGEWVSAQGRTQFRLAETEKYPHVTFFLNGGVEAPYPGEDRHMPQSPKVATYDLQPEMSAPEVGDTLVDAIQKRYDLIVVNFANPDMVGHTGKLDAAVKAVEAVDFQLGRALAALEAVGGALLLTADHGNAELMVDPVTGGPHTAHTTNLVPVALFGGPAGVHLADGRLADLAPTLLDLMELPKPAEMTGTSLLRR